jgi:hypothetical protein
MSSCGVPFCNDRGEEEFKRRDTEYAEKNERKEGEQKDERLHKQG